jgi:hypothetical protein
VGGVTQGMNCLQSCLLFGEPGVVDVAADGPDPQWTPEGAVNYPTLKSSRILITSGHLV